MLLKCSLISIIDILLGIHTSSPTDINDSILSLTLIRFYVFEFTESIASPSPARSPKKGKRERERERGGGGEEVSLHAVAG